MDLLSTLLLKSQPQVFYLSFCGLPKNLIPDFTYPSFFYCLSANYFDLFFQTLRFE
jgi:hypothetical protein